MYKTLSQVAAPRAALGVGAPLVLGGAALIALGAQVQVPLWPVPITLQTLVVLLLGAALGARRGALAVVAYLGAAALGLPVLAGGGAGALKLFGPTGGYLIGFILAAYLVGRLVERFALDRRVLGAALAMLLGNAVIYLCGVSWLAAALHLTPGDALNTGLTPFLLGDALKIGVAAALLPSAWAWLGRR